jgi:hypothetical protein
LARIANISIYVDPIEIATGDLEIIAVVDLDRYYLPKGERKAPRFIGGDELGCGLSRLKAIPLL